MADDEIADILGGALQNTIIVRIFPNGMDDTRGMHAARKALDELNVFLDSLIRQQKLPLQYVNQFVTSGSEIASSTTWLLVNSIKTRG